MFKTFSLFAIIAIASANTDEKTGDEKTEETKPEMVAMTAAEITEACNANMATLCTELKDVTVTDTASGKLQEDPSDQDDPDLCADAQADVLKELCTDAGTMISAGVATDAEQTAKDDMKELLDTVTESIKASGATTTVVGTWTTGMKEVKKETTDTEEDKEDAEGDKEASALNLVAGSATLLAVSTMMLQ